MNINKPLRTNLNNLDKSKWNFTQQLSKSELNEMHKIIYGPWEYKTHSDLSFEAKQIQFTLERHII